MKSKESIFLKNEDMIKRMAEIQAIALTKNSNMEIEIKKILDDYIKQNISETNLEKEMKKLIGKKFISGENNWELVWYHNLKKMGVAKTTNAERINSIYFTKESIDNFINSPFSKVVTEDFFYKTYRKLFNNRKDELEQGCSLEDLEQQEQLFGKER